MWQIGEWVWVYNHEAAIRQGASPQTNDQVLKAKLSLNWTGPWKILVVGPATTSPDKSPVADKLLYPDLPSGMPGQDSKRRVSVARCKPCANPHDLTDMPRYLPAGLTQYVLNSYTSKAPPYHVTTDDVEADAERIEVERITGHQSVRGRGGKLAVLYETHWKGLLQPSWEREIDLQHFRRSILDYWVGPSHQSRSCNHLYRRMRASAAARELARASGGRPLTKGYRLVAKSLWTGTFQRTPLPKGAQFWFKANDGFWWLGKIASPTAAPERYIVRFLDDPGPVRLALNASLYTTAPDAVRGSWCLQIHVSGGISAGLLRNADDSRSADIITFADPASTS